MRFTFVDRVLDFEPGVRITTVKCLTLAEEYLADHFPRFPVMPGVLMVQAMTDASSWLVRITEDFAHSMLTLKEARNVRFADFVQPGHALTVTAELLGLEGNEARLKTQATVDGHVAVSGRLILERSNLADTRPDRADADAYLKQYFRSHFALISSSAGETLLAAGSPSAAPNGNASEPPPSKV